MSDVLANRIALVTGASQGIGAGIARALDRAGAHVAVVARNEDRLETVRAELQHPSVAIVADLEEADAPARVVAETTEALGPVDILVNNAGVGARIPTVDLDAALIDRLLAVNVRAPLLLCKSVVPAMQARGSGVIVNVSSVSGLIGTPRRSLYGATKGAIDAATRSLAVELGPSGIRVVAVAPGVVDTAMWAQNRAIPGVIEEVEQMTPLRRWSVPDDIADVVVFLASDGARFITGETIAVDGGMARTADLYAGAV